MIAELLSRVGDRPKHDKIVRGLNRYAAATVEPSSGLNLGEDNFRFSAIVFKETAFSRSRAVKRSDAGNNSKSTSNKGA